MNEQQHRPSKKQRELLTFIAGFIKANGYGPSYREIMNGLGYKSVSTVATHVDNLIAKGHVRKRDYSARSLEVVTQISEFTEEPKVTKTNIKWLVDQITARFDAAEANPKLLAAQLDDLYVLVGALHILGVEDAAAAFKRRLIALRDHK